MQSLVNLESASSFMKGIKRWYEIHTQNSGTA